MSYVRWSTEVHGVMSFDEEMRLQLVEGWTYPMIKAEKLKRGGEISDWYIYWHCNSGDRRDDQIISINLAGGECLELSYDEVVPRMERDFWEDLFPDRPQREVMDIALKRWIEAVEEKYPNG